MKMPHSLHSLTHHPPFIIFNCRFFLITTSEISHFFFPCIRLHFSVVFFCLFCLFCLVPISLLPCGTQSPVIPLLRYIAAYGPFPHPSPTGSCPLFPSFRHIPDQCLKSFNVHHLNICSPILSSHSSYEMGIKLHCFLEEENCSLEECLVACFSSATSKGQSWASVPGCPPQKPFASPTSLLPLDQNFSSHRNGYALGPYFLS